MTKLGWKAFFSKKEILMKFSSSKNMLLYSAVKGSRYWKNWGPKRVQRIQKATKTDKKWDPKASQMCAKKRQVQTQLRVLSMWKLMPKGTPNDPKWIRNDQKRTPNDPQMCPKCAPEGAKCRKTVQEAPKWPHGSSESPKMTPKGTQRDPKTWSKRDPRTRKSNCVFSKQFGPKFERILGAKMDHIGGWKLSQKKWQQQHASI